MKPSRFFYILAGASAVGAAIGSYPGSGGLSMFCLILSCIAAVTFDWNNA